MSLGVDVGGTFTDVVLWDGVRLVVGKTASTPDQSVGVLSGSRQVLAGGSVSTLVHGTTVATNALLERKGAPTALITNDGFLDVIAIGRQDRPSLYDSFADRPVPLVAAEHRFGLDSSNLGSANFDALRAAIVGNGLVSVAVCLMYSFVDDVAEQRIREELAGLGLPISLSSEIVPEFREFERTSTTVLNAYLTPPMKAYLDNLAVGVAGSNIAEEVLVMRSSGGLMSLKKSASLPAAALLSGPAGGVIATAALARDLGYDRVVAFDMGGTSTDVCRIESGEPEVRFHREVAGYPCLMPSVAVHTVGAGGGSIAWVDPGGALRVGPQSAGATPGPACYRKGGSQPTVTDANVVLGRIAPDALLAGEVAIDVEAAVSAVSALGEGLNLNAVTTAEGILRVAEAHMGRAIRAVSIEEGADPREARLVAFGGAGGLHATQLARTLDMRGVVVPPMAGVFSAFGLLLAPPRNDASHTVHLSEGDDLESAVEAVADVAVEGLVAMAVDLHAVSATADVRYVGQAHETSVGISPKTSWAEVEQRFTDAHITRNGFSRPGDPIELVTVRASAVGTPTLTWDQISFSPGPPVDSSQRSVVFDGTGHQALVVQRGSLAPGDVVIGPAIVEESESTTVLAPGDRLTVHSNGALEISW
jgi:N-methylhydantoinase A